MRIKVGYGTSGDIFEDLEKVKACNFCIYFKGYGLYLFGLFMMNFVFGK